MKIGIPRSLLYYYDGVFWKYFFEKLNIDTITSSKTNKEIISNGEVYADSEMCLSMKIFLGDIVDLKDKCDAILIPRLYSIKKDEQVCTNFNSMYDLVKNLFPNIKIINYNIDLYEKKNEVLAYTTLGKNLGFDYITSYNAYCYAKDKEKEYLRKKINIQNKKLNNNKIKILLAGHPYNIHDEIIGKDIIKYLKDNDIEIIYSTYMYKDLIDSESNKISTDIHWSHSKKVVGAISYFQNKVDGIILISTFPCGPDSLSNEMIKRKVNKPLLIINRESYSNTGIITRLEAFIDILKVKYERCH